MEIKNKCDFECHIPNVYMAKQKHTNPYPNYVLSVYGDYGYALYKRNGQYMDLIDFFHSYEEANKQAKDILDIKHELRNSITFPK